MIDSGTVLGIAIILLPVIFGAGYIQGKKSLFLILRGHESDGDTLKQALDAEMIAHGLWKEKDLP